MKMKSSIRKRYLRFLLPGIGLLLALAFLLLLFSGFGFRYWFRKPEALGELRADELRGKYVTVPVSELGDSFLVFGYQDDSGSTVVREQYCLYLVDGQYLIVRVTEKDIPKLTRWENAEDLVTSGKVGSLLEVNFGSFTGTVNRMKDAEVLGRLRSWLTAHQLSGGTDNYSGADISGYEGAAGGDYTAYLDAAILPLVLEIGYLGTRSAGTVILLTILALVLVLLAILLGVSILLGLWEKPAKAAVREYGLKRLAGDYDLAGIAGDSLRIGNDFLWVFGTLTTHIYEIRELVWLYPRSRRLEGGKKRWSLVLKTEHGEEDAAPLDSEWAVEQAIQTVIARGWPITVGFDKEKQRLYKKDLAAFRGRVRNGTI